MCECGSVNTAVLERDIKRCERRGACVNVCVRVSAVKTLMYVSEKHVGAFERDI